MSQSAVEQAVAQLIDAGLVTPDGLQGCTPEEIAQIEKKFQLNLPAVYKEFLSRMGKSAGKFLVGTDYLFPALLHLRDDAEDILEESGVNFRFGPAHFVFVGHQGYEFLFFDAAESPDPAVSHVEEAEEPGQVFAHFSEWLLTCVADEIAAFQSLRKTAPRKSG